MNSRRNRTLIIIGIVLFVVAMAAITYRVLHRHNTATVTTGTPSQGQTNSNGQSSSTTPGNNDSTNPDTAKNPSGNTTPPAGGEVVAPSGTFVSNHSPKLDSTSGENKLSSVCRTSPGAVCYIQFTQGTTTKKLPEKTTATDATVEWEYTLQEVGLTQGTWKIEAIATSGTSSKTTADQINLEVRQ